jgi:SAM-dependent methyltransferase
MVNTYRFNNVKFPLSVMEIALTFRGLLFLGTKYTCPCCGWRVRDFTKGNALLKKRPLSYCPRCNSKARHRRIWLFLQQNTNLFNDQLSLFEVSPKYSFSRRFTQMVNISYVAADLYDRPHISFRMDLVEASLKSERFDAVLCVHVLEEIMDDRRAMEELFRILKPGGWAVISVPTRMDQVTYEDPTITAPKERKRAFGEPDHVRIYGYDLKDKLEACGFNVQVDLADTVPLQTREKYGLRGIENIFYCIKP